MSRTNSSIYIERLEKVQRLMRQHYIDTWLIVTREGTDSSVPFLFGIRSVSIAAILLRDNGQHIVVTSKSDKGNYEATGLFPTVVPFEDSLEETFLPIWREQRCKTLALNISETDSFCDGLSQGLYEWVKETIGIDELKEIEVSSKPILQSLKDLKAYNELEVNKKVGSNDYPLQREKLDQATKFLMEDNIDTWLIVTRNGEDPALPLIGGFECTDTLVIVVTKNNVKIVICHDYDAADIEKSNLFDYVHIYQDCIDATLQSVVGEINPKSIAINSSKREHVADGLSAGTFKWLKSTLSEVFKGHYVTSESFLTKLRAVKSASELERIKKAIWITEEIYQSVYLQLRTGMTEKEVGQIFVDEMEKRGVINGIDRTLSMPIVMKENIAHRAPGDAVIKPGDLVIFDFSVDVDGYVSDIARTVYFLKEEEEHAPIEIQLAFLAVHEAISRAAGVIRPGVKGYEVDDAARSYYLSKGYPEITHATGHQIGREVHDGGALLAPRWKRYGDAPLTELEEGMVFTIEPTLFLDGGIHFIVEENVVVTSTGINYLTNRQNELIVIKPK